MNVPEIATLFIGLSGHHYPTTEEAQKKVIELLTDHFPSFTITEATGFFREKQEKVLIVHIATSIPQKVADCAGIIRSELKQEGVGIAFRGRYLRATEGFAPDLLQTSDA